MEYSVNSYRKVAIEKKFSELKQITEETTEYVSDQNKEMDPEFKKACAEVLAVLSNTKSEIKDEVPNSMLLFLEGRKDPNEIVSFDFEKDIDELPLSQKASLLIAIVYRSYLCPNKDALDEILLKNEKKKKKKATSLANLTQEEVKDELDDNARLRKDYLLGLENFDTLEDYLDDEYEFNKFLDDKEDDFTEDLSYKEKIDMKKLDRKTRKRAAKELEMFEDRLESVDFANEKQKKREKRLTYKLIQKIKSKKKIKEEEDEF